MASASGGGLTDAQIESRLNRLEARRSTNFNAASVLAVGVITVLGTLGGVWLGNDQTADAADARADEDFAREQRIETYGEFLATVDRTMGLLAARMPEIEDFKETPLTELDLPSTDEYAEVTQAMTSVETLVGRISVIGGEETTALAADVRTGLGQTKYVLDLARMCQDDPGADNRCSSPADTATPPYRGDKYSAYMGDHFAASRIAFLDRARSQLGMPD